MKKATLNTIYTALTNYGFSDETVLSELSKEINRNAEVKAKSTAAYDGIHDLLMETLSTEQSYPFSEIYASMEDSLPEGMTKGKVQYAISHLWQDEIVKVIDKPMRYRKVKEPII